MEIKQKLKSCLSMLIAFTVGFSCISPTAFADENNLGAKRKQVIGVADRILERDDLATRFRGTTYTDNENYDNFSDTLWYNTWENAQKWKFKANGLSENECDNAIGEMLYNEAVYGFPMSHFLKKDGLYKGPYKIVKVKKIAGKKYYQEIYKKEKDSDNNDIELNDIKALFDENVRIIKEGNSYDIQMNVKTDKVQSLSAAYINRIAGKEVYREYIKDPVNNEKDGGFLLGGIPGELTGENIVVFDMTYVDASGSKRTLEPFGIEIDYAALQRKNDWELPNYKKNLLDKAQEFQMNTSAIMSSEDAKYVDEHKKKIIDKALSEIDEFIKSDDISYDRFYDIANPIIDMEYGFKMIHGIKNMIKIHKSSIGTLYTNKTYSQKSLDEFEKYLDDLEKDLTFKTLKDLVLDSYKVNNASMIMLRYNTSKLEELIKQAGAKKQSDYTVESYLKMLQVKAEAEKWVELCKVYKDPSNETSTLEKKLEKALKDLVPTKPEVEKVKLTLIGENITSTPQAGDIEKGTEIVITLTPDTNKVVKVFTVNDVDKKSKLQDNKYKFNIQENTTVKVEYENKPQIEEKVYTVDVKFLNADGIGSLSMANQCLDSRAKLVMGKENKLMLKLMPMYKENSPTGIIDKIYYYDIDHTKVELKTLETKKIKISYQEYEQEYVYPTKVEMPVDGESNKISMHMTVKSPMLGNDPHPNDAILTIDYENKTDGYEEEQDNDKKKELSDAVYYLQEGLKTYSYLIPSKMQKETRNLIAEGKKVLNNYSATPEQIDEMLAKITKQREKINKLISVHRLYEDAKATYKDDVESGKYSKESMEAMKKVLDRAAELISKQDITDEDIDELLSMDLANIYKLERYNTSKLQEEIKKSKEVLNNGKTYTKETKEALEIVIEKAEKYVNDAKETRWIADERESLIKELQEKVGELKVTQAPEVDKTPLVNKIAEAEAIAQGKKTDVAYQELQNAIQTAKQKLNTINTVEALKNAVNELQAAIDKFNSSADIPQELDKTPLVNKIAEAEAIAQGKKTDVAYQELQNAIQTAKQKLNTINTVEDLQAAVNELDNAINTFKLSADAPETPLQKLYREFSEEIEAAKSLTDESDKFPQAYNILQSAIEKAETELNENKDNIHALKLSFNNFKISVVEYKDSNYTALEEIENILKQKDPDEYIMAQGVISATIYKLNDQEPSMADKSLVKPVRILLTNKGYRLVLAFRSANMGFLKGFLGELYADKNQGFNILEPISTYNVIDVYNDPETGKDIKMKGNKYPKETIVSIDKNTNLLPVKVYIPALENMSPGDGTKKANIQFDWNTLEINKVFTTSLKNKIAEAESITQGKKTSAAYQELQNAVQTAKQKLNTVNTIDDLQNAVNELQAAIDKFNSSADIPQELDKTPLVNKIAEAEAIAQGKKTDVAYQELQNAIQTAKQKLNTINTVEALKNAVNELQAAIDKFNSSADIPQELDKTPLVNKIAEAEAIAQGKKTDVAYQELQNAIQTAKQKLNTINTVE
ncbi:MAG: S-layer homology domain-containing protein, partial [Peptoanaerobacter stomatis]|uniref:S-layer homology domain-containing protein n=1 Tax=Peptoanaerobacter stomatis TaxID=796937 RepID=UPI003FA181C8